MLQALYWSLGAALMEDGREKFDAFVKDHAALPTKTVDDDKLAGAGEIPGTHARTHTVTLSVASPAHARRSASVGRSVQ